MSSRGINKVIVLGRLGDDPSVRFMPNGGQVTNITVATSETWRDKDTGEQKEATEWHRIVFFNKLAEIAGQYLKKGSNALPAHRIIRRGRLEARRHHLRQHSKTMTSLLIKRRMTA